LISKIRAGMLPALLVFFVVLGSLNWWWRTANQGRYRDWLTAAYVMVIVKCRYYQPVSWGRLARAYLKTGTTAGMLEILPDPYTRFLTRDDYAELRKDTEGSFGGIGIFLLTQENRLTISSVVKGSPGERAGLLPGDRIVAVENILVSQSGTAAAMAKMKGSPGTNVKIRAVRKSGALRREFELEITREKVLIPTVELNFKAEPKWGQYAHLVISQFAETTPRDLEQKLSVINANRACRALLLDLRGNPGGEFDAALRIVGDFLPSGVPVLHIKRRGQRLETVTNRYKSRSDLPMVVLVDGGSASASEIVSGALKDQNRAILVGTPTFGKDLIQQIIELPGGIAVSVTIASYLTSGKVNIHQQGVRPDYIVPSPHATSQSRGAEETALAEKVRKLQEAAAIRILKRLCRPAAETGKTAA
jgi:carboxyl-terminal processing protease